MRKIESMRESLSNPTFEHLQERQRAGWRLTALEWQREVEEIETQPEAPSAKRQSQIDLSEIPFGTRIADDGLHLEENPSEMEVLNSLAEMIVQDISYTQMAERLNERALSTREGKPWNAVAVFKLTPRLIEIAPRILTGSAWDARKKQLSQVAWNS